jgi:hypothetical protein
MAYKYTDEWISLIDKGLERKDDYTAEYTSYSGCDIIASIRISKNKPPIVLGELQTISYSIHREVQPVRTLSRSNPVGFTRGQRTIAGSLIFTVFDKNIVNEIKRESGLQEISLADEMPRFDVDIIMQNEYGGASAMRIEGIIIVDEGQVMSIEDMLTENTMSYMATDIKVLDVLEK